MSKPHGIRIPGILLDELKTADYNNDDRFAGKKRKQRSQIGRKEKRKQQRLAKKQTKSTQKQDSNPGERKLPVIKRTKSSSDKSKRQDSKEARNVKQKAIDKPFSSDDDLSSGDFEEFDSEDLDEEEWNQLRDLEGGSEPEQEGNSGDDASTSDIDALTAEETTAELKKIKDKKNAKVKKVSKTSERSNEQVSSGSEATSAYSSSVEYESDNEPMTVEETMAALKRMKEQKSGQKSKTSKSLKDEDELLSSASEIEDTDSISMEYESDAEPMTAAETMAALKKMKAEKDRKAKKKERLSEGSDEEWSSENDDEGELQEPSSEESDSNDQSMTAEETMAALKRMKESKKSKEASGTKMKQSRTEKYAKPALPPSELVQAQKDKWDYDYYSKKLGIKGKNKKLKAKDEFDAIGGLLEGLDFFENYGDEGSASEEEDSGSDEEREADSVSDYDNKSSSQHEAGDDTSDEENPFSSDDEISEGDFDEFDEDDLNEEEWEELRELEGGEKRDKRSKRENPYVAPITEETTYIPPSLRKKNLDDSESETVIELRRKIKSSLNKLSESNITVIVSALNQIYDSYPRQHVNEALAHQMLEMVSQRDKLLDSFVINYAAVVFSLWKLRGIEVGASFIQALVERLLEVFQRQEKLFEQHTNDEQPNVSSKESNNLIALLSYCYNFGLVSCRLIYDLVEMLIKTPNEFTTELLLRVVSISGQLIRGDDPKALKEIITVLLNNVKNVQQSPRMKFLLEVMSDLKNNRLKPSLLALSHSGLKKNLSNFLNSSVTSASDPLQVTLDDINNIETKGKWWLVGASWKGNMDSAFTTTSNSTATSGAVSTNIVVEDNILDDIPDWSEIARSQRMNTEVRRAIFVSIMSAQDFMDAFTNIEKLNLKNKQSIEIPRVLVHCLTMEGKSGTYNPFYGLLAVKLCQHNHHVSKAFQFMFWDLTKKFEHEDDSSDEDAREDDLDENEKLKKVSCQGRFFGTLLAEEVLKLDIFKHVPLMGGLNSDGTLFVEILLFQFLLSVAPVSYTHLDVYKRQAL